MKEKTQPCDSSTAHLLSAQGKAANHQRDLAPSELTSVSLGINLCLPWNYRYDQFEVYIQLQL